MIRTLLNNAAARRVFLDRHALAGAPTGPARGADLAQLIDRLGFVQLDSIQTVERAHHMILWARRSSYRPPALKCLHEVDRILWEHWTHDAAILPVHLYRHWQHAFPRREARLRAHWGKWFRPGYEAQIVGLVDRIRAEGPVSTSDVGMGEARGAGGWWDWNPSKTALEWLWHTGQLAVTRRDGFQKVYDLAERVIPQVHRGEMSTVAEMVDWACQGALDRLGFADVSQLRGFWGLVTPAEARDWVRAALRSGQVVEIEVEGASGAVKRSLARPDVLAACQNLAQPARRVRVLSPFDPALRDRDRAEFLFGFAYRIEVFVPEAKRKYGYYVFPVLEGDQLIGRLDCKAFRDAGVLHVKAFWPEVGVRMRAGRLVRLAAELDRLARFAGCDRVGFADGWLRETLGQGGPGVAAMSLRRD
ncbi:MAG: crosslink repair DNA glycosylase YcaQ family protein [Alphaproteobacteria bacterium]